MTKFIAGAIAAALIFFGSVFGVYAAIAFFDWLFTDPFNWVERESAPGTVQNAEWDACVYDAKRLFDDFNDTVGATYAVGDTPSEGVKTFMEWCLKTSTQ